MSVSITKSYYWRRTDNHSADCYTFSPHTMSEAGSVGDSLASKETPLFDIKKCTAEIQRQRTVLRIKNVARAQLQDICDHVFSRETIEKGVSPMALDDIVETRFDKLLEDILKINYNEYQTGTKVSITIFHSLFFAGSWCT
jgi:hypothetical protein